MGKNKLLRYKEIKTLDNVVDLGHFRPGFVHEFRGKWSEKFFGNHNPIVLELACGKGDYTLGLAKMNPDINDLGLDMKGERLWKATKESEENNLQNTGFIRTRIDFLDHLFGENEIDEIWITFPDPYLRESKESKRLTSTKFLNQYSKVLKPNGLVHLKTDSPELYAFTLETIQSENVHIHQNISDIYALPKIPDVLKIKTYYEGKHLEAGRIIRYVQFGFNV